MDAAVSLDIRERVSDEISGSPYNRTHRGTTKTVLSERLKRVTNKGAYLNNKTQP